MDNLLHFTATRILREIDVVITNSRSSEVYHSSMPGLVCFNISFGKRDFHDIKEIAALNDVPQIVALNQLMLEIKDLCKGSNIGKIDYLARLKEDKTLEEVLLEVHTSLKSSPFVGELMLEETYNQFREKLNHSEEPVETLSIPLEFCDAFTKHASLIYRLSERLSEITGKEVTYSPIYYTFSFGASIKDPEIPKEDLDNLYKLLQLLLIKCNDLPLHLSGGLNVPENVRDLLVGKPSHIAFITRLIAGRTQRNVTFNPDYCLFLVSECTALTSQET